MTDVSQHFTSTVTPSDSGPRATWYYKGEGGHLVEMLTRPIGDEHAQETARIELMQALMSKSAAWSKLFPSAYRPADFAMVARMLMLRAVHKLSQPEVTA